jgi:hypothetical protein
MFSERSMGLVQRILWISMYLIYELYIVFAHPTLVVVLFRLWFCWALLWGSTEAESLNL